MKHYAILSTTLTSFPLNSTRSLIANNCLLHCFLRSGTATNSALPRYVPYLTKIF